MRKCKTTLLAIAVVLGIGGAAIGEDRDRDRDSRYRESGNYSAGSSSYLPSYQQGYEDGARQAEHDLRRGNRGNLNQGLKSRDRSYREGYQAAYDRMYSNSGNYNTRGGYGDRQVYGNQPYSNDPYGNGPYANGSYGNGSYSNGSLYRNGSVGNAQNDAYRVGYQDGMADGGNDRSTGHSFRPTHDDNFKHADRGYNSSMGDKQFYKDTYRQGYQAAYSLEYQGHS